MTTLATPKRPRPAASPVDRVKRASAVLKHLGNPTRLAILVLLATQGRSVTELWAELGGVGQPALSHHLCLLRHGRLVDPTRSGKRIYYSLTDSGRALIDGVRAVLADHP